MTEQAQLTDRERELLATLKRLGYQVSQMMLRNRSGRNWQHRRVVYKRAS